MRRFLREPLVHFLLLGALIFVVNTWREPQRAAVNAEAKIEVTAGTIAWLREGYVKQWHREPDAEELRGLVNDHLREEVLYREALAMGLDRNDSIVRRRMAQKMEFLTQDIAAAAEPDEAALRKYFAENGMRYAKAAKVSFRHVFFSRERRGEKLESEARDALAALAKGTNEETMGDPFLREYEFKDASTEAIASALGRDFADKVATLPAEEWSGPVPSSYGVHLVWVSGRTEPQAVAFESVRDSVLRDFADERRRTTNKDFLERLKAQYQITVDEAALQGVATPATKTAAR